MEQVKVVVAMSGGVDSSVTAALLKQRGYSVMGVTMKLSESPRIEKKYFIPARPPSTGKPVNREDNAAKNDRGEGSQPLQIKNNFDPSTAETSIQRGEGAQPLQIKNNFEPSTAESSDQRSEGAQPLQIKNNFDTSTSRSCCTEEAIEDARRVADTLGIPHYVVDLRAEFSDKVISRFLSDYARGFTPNPCVECNRYLKFGAFLRRALELGATHIATGHYARITRSDGRYHLRKALDPRKDQSYVLYNIAPDSLSKILFPLGDLTKDQTRALAEQFNLPVAHKSDSQEICFVPNDDYRAYLRHHAPDSLTVGDIVDINGNVLGHHNGVALYTIGQRKGLGISSPTPLYVVELDPVNNRIVVGSDNDVFSNGLIADDCNWLEHLDNTTFDCAAKIRYHHKDAACTVELLHDHTIKINFKSPQRAVTPGQSVVLYDDDRVLGGGIIVRRF